MSRVLSIHSQRFRLGAITLLLATGAPADINDHVRDDIANKLNLVSAGVRADGERAMVLYIDDDNAFSDSTEDAKQTAISSDLVKAILEGYNPDKWTFLSMFHAGKSKLDAAIGGKLLGQAKAVKQFAKDFARAIYGKGGYVAGSSANTKTLLLFAPDSERYILAWNYQETTDQDVVLARPWGKDMTRYSVAGNNLIAVKAGDGQLKAMSFQQIQDKLVGADIGKDDDWKLALKLKDAKIDDLTIGNPIGRDTYAVIASGNFHGQQGLKVLNVTTDGDNLRILPTTQPTIALDEQIADYGSPVRYDMTSVTFVNRSGKNSVTRVPMHALPSQVKDAFTQQASA